MARKIFYFVLSLLGAPLKFIFKDRLRVLAYHDVNNQLVFADQMNYLRNNYSIISIEDLNNNLFRKTPLPKNPLLITFDDGDISVLKNGLPILKRLSLPSCLFIITDLINSNKNFWWETVIENEKNLGIPDFDINKILVKLKNIPNAERLGYLQFYPKIDKDQLTLIDLKEMNNAGFSIGNHSHTHPMFDKCTDSEIISELSNSKKLFDAWELGKFDIFAYPNGNYSDGAEKLLISHKIKLAFLFDHKLNSRIINPLRISRIRINSDTGIYEFKSKVSGIHSIMLMFRRLINL